MNIYAAASLFAALILLYWIISEIFTMLFRLVGLPEDKARFQVTSLLTACGFTTRESEMFLSTRSRRRLARSTMMFGFIFNITIVSAFINFFVSFDLSGITSSLTSLLIPAAVVTGIVVMVRSRAVRVWLDRKMEKLAGRISGAPDANSVMLMDQIGSDCIAQVTLNTVPDFLKDKTLGESGLKTEYNLLVLLTERNNQKAEVPPADLVFREGDRLTLFGEYKKICTAFNAREYFSDQEE